MIELNDYLYDGHTVIRILHNYHDDLYHDALKTGNEIDLVHAAFLRQQIAILEHNDFLTSQSNRIKELYKYMAAKYPDLAFTFRGRIKSLIRAEEKFNGYVAEYIYNEYKNKGKCDNIQDLKDKLANFRDLVAYRIVISLPKCHVKDEKTRKQKELDYLYEIAGILPEFLEKRGFTVMISENDKSAYSDKLSDKHSYFRDYIKNPGRFGYQSLHITLYDNESKCYIELQLRTKEMDDIAEIGAANHQGYEAHQAEERMRRDSIPLGENIYFDEAWKREYDLMMVELKDVDVNMFGAVNNSLVNDGCGLLKGRLILPFEHLSGFQNDIID